MNLLLSIRNRILSDPQSAVDFHIQVGLDNCPNLFFKQCLFEEKETKLARMAFVEFADAQHYVAPDNLYSVEKASSPVLFLPIDNVPVIESDIDSLFHSFDTKRTREELETITPQEQVACDTKQAITDLWNAVGFGMHLILPFGNPSSTQTGLEILEEKLKNNPILLTYYKNQLDIMRKVMTGCIFQMVEFSSYFSNLDPAYKEAFYQGVNARESIDPWFQKDALAHEEESAFSQHTLFSSAKEKAKEQQPVEDQTKTQSDEPPSPP